MKNESLSFEEKLVQNLKLKKKEGITAKVLLSCIKSGFITQRDVDMRSERYKWLQKVLDLNLHSFGLLDETILDSRQCSIGNKFQAEVDKKVEVLIKDIVRRLIATSVELTDYDTAEGGESDVRLCLRLEDL
ncbi:hypothetical protein VCRA2113O120_330014 [Vibrio crassostreae]|uniref:hypothetical protein n=1 Tax=Vibrio crassostreae TaxID=246167 RepID=UPI001B303CC0|nr:hypothetical protein [Vibrio crassostreae]CAK1941897.1 hypothetical protein VCRA2114E123_290014 [Vibrio crassostreae]CAK1947968.1 hypothetical protein VCRA2114E122_290014 [Vibrio crassostreae]CAK2014120.1 hypothetical protein VCRA2113O120_330014 [Vibrio crassostreae]CAK2329250.1 hypothetical protein VCRA2112O114_330032 [Vibrio crassostreae]CAK2329754.1 hypothetical protein VCRA2112O115_330032 [Vibrio crassostreae]